MSRSQKKPRSVPRALLRPTSRTTFIIVRTPRLETRSFPFATVPRAERAFPGYLWTRGAAALRSRPRWNVAAKLFFVSLASTRGETSSKRRVFESVGKWTGWIRCTNDKAEHRFQRTTRNYFSRRKVLAETSSRSLLVNSVLERYLENQRHRRDFVSFREEKSSRSCSRRVVRATLYEETVVQSRLVKLARPCGEKRALRRERGRPCCC